MLLWKIRSITYWEDAPEARFGYKAAGKGILNTLIRLSRMAGRGAATLPLGESAPATERDFE
ncbi:hypothetical protein D3C72_2389370 [compost metagenome]